MKRATSAAAAVLWIISSTALAESPSGFELLEKIRRSYQSLGSYSDLGEVEIETSEAASKRTVLRFFETVTEPDGRFLFRTHGESSHGYEERAIWSDGQETFVYSNLHRQYRRVESVTAELALGFGFGAQEALIVPLILLGGSEALTDPEAASVEGPESCGDTTCWILLLSHAGETVKTEIWAEQGSYLIRQVNVRMQDSPAIYQAAIAAEATSPSEGEESSLGELTLRVRHHLSEAGSPSFSPPSDARQVASWEAEDDPAADLAASSSQLAFHDEVTVALVSVVARIVDSHGTPLLDMTPDDLIARAGKQRLPVASLDFSSSDQSFAKIPAAELAEARRLAMTGDLSIEVGTTAASGRLVVFFVQADLHASRAKGHMKILPDLEKLLDALHPVDRTAIVSFDSHLKLWLDITRDRDLAYQTLKRAITYATPEPHLSTGDSLARYFDREAAQDIATPEDALHFVGDALSFLPGEKDLVFLGWGLGRYGVGGVRMTAEFGPAVRALVQAKATAFVLDISQADSHSLSVGLQNVAASTGGTYDSTFRFGTQAVRRLARTIGGHYIIHIDRSSLPEARGRLTIELKNRKGLVLFKPITLG